MSFPPRPRYDWQLRTRNLSLGVRTRIMGIVNVTPDSFSDGGKHATTQRAVWHALRLLDEGADIIDVGGESTRPGSPAMTDEAISTGEEQARVLPVIDGVLRVRPDAVISVDTYRAATARAAINAGAEIVNDVSGGLWDRAMLATCADLSCGFVLMHTRGLPSLWDRQTQLEPHEVVSVVLGELQERQAAAVEAGIEQRRIIADPGFGFGKRGEENWAMLAGFSALANTALPLLAGLSRKGFLALAESNGTASQRDDLSHAAHVAAVLSGAHVLRVHDARGSVRSAGVADAILAPAASVTAYANAPC